MPSDPGNGTAKLIVSVHFYAPNTYTVASPGDLKHTLTSAELNYIDAEARKLKAAFIDNGIAVYYGEWGAPTYLREDMSQDIKDTHIDYIRRVATATSANGIVPIYWDAAEFKLLQRSDGLPYSGFCTEVLNVIKTAIN